MEIRIMINAILVGFWLTNFIPLQDWLNKYIQPKIKNKYISKLLMCWQCQSFQITLIWGLIALGKLLIIEAILASLIVYTYNKIINSLKIHF